MRIALKSFVPDRKTMINFAQRVDQLFCLLAQEFLMLAAMGIAMGKVLAKCARSQGSNPCQT